MKKVLLPTDFTANALHGILYGIQLLKNVPCEFYLLHAYNATHTTGVLISISDILEQEAKQVLTVEAKKIQDLLPQQQLRIQPCIHPGTLKEAITETIKNEKIDLVVMGTKGNSSTYAAIWGSNTANTLQGIHTPLLVIPNGYLFHPPQEILIALDHEVGNNMNGQLKPLHAILENYSPSLTFIHIAKPEKVHQNNHNPTHWLHTYKHAHQTIEYNTDVVSGLKKYISNWSTDLLVMVAHKYTFCQEILHKSLTKKIVGETSVPVLVLND